MIVKCSFNDIESVCLTVHFRVLYGESRAEKG
jgi:hypothetical protein